MMLVVNNDQINAVFFTVVLDYTTQIAFENCIQDVRFSINSAGAFSSTFKATASSKSDGCRYPADSSFTYKKWILLL